MTSLRARWGIRNVPGFRCAPSRLRATSTVGGKAKVEAFTVATTFDARVEHGHVDLSKLLAIGCLLAATQGYATSIYRCNTPGGVIFSEKSCAPGAFAIKTKSSRTTLRNSPAGRPGGPLPSVDFQKFSTLGVQSTEKIIAVVGRPAASYMHGDIEHWLYPNAVRRSELGSHCPEVLLVGGKSFQIAWLPEPVMKKSVAIASGFADWSPPTEIKEKPFDLADAEVAGSEKANIISSLGQPDAKRVFNGNEIWEYEKVRLAPDKAETVTIFMEFDGEFVTTSAEN